MFREMMSAFILSQSLKMLVVRMPTLFKSMFAEILEALEALGLR